MNENKKLVIAIVFICIVFSRINVFANISKEVFPETLAVTLVIDTSGSMEITDPKNLREAAANIFIDLLSPDDYLGIITFNTKMEVVIPIQQIQSSDNKANFKKVLSQNLHSTGDTDYLLALNEASKQLSTVNEGNVRKVIVFLTDGEPDPNSKKSDPTFMNPYMDSLWKAVSNLALNKYEVYSVGFSKGVNPAILERISNSTKGTFKICEDSSELAISCFDILKNIRASGNKDSFNKPGQGTPDNVKDEVKEAVKEDVSIEATATKDNRSSIIIVLGIIMALPLIIILLGLLLYRILVYRNTIIQGELSYWKESDFEAEDKKVFNLNKLSKDKIVITFNKENKDAQYHIFDSEYDYDIELTSIVQKSRWKCIDGFKALFSRNNSSELLLKVIEPGIFIYEDKVFTSKKIYKNDKFITGGYIFQYFSNQKGNLPDKDKGKNLLKK